jgi:hypothetical protein
MNELTDEQKDALIAALETGDVSGVPAFLTSPTLCLSEPEPYREELSRTAVLLAQSLKREREAIKVLDTAVVAVIGLDAKCRARGYDPGDYFDRVHAACERLRGPIPPPPEIE